jgi:hypothetical protein
MWRSFWTSAIALVFIISLGSLADAQTRRSDGHRKAPEGAGQPESPGNGNQSENPGNGDQDGEPAEDPPRRTPDGLTPAEEDICDDLKYATPGLYGLCIAFCEAHDSDCVPDFSVQNPFSNCERRDARILQQYERKRKDGDPDMPCLPSAGEDPEYACPCWSQEELEFFPFSLTSWQAESNHMSCEMNAEEPYYDDDEETGEEFLVCTQYMNYVSENSNLAGDAVFYFNLEASIGDCDGTYCSSFVGCWGNDCPPELVGRDEFGLEIGQEEYLNCQAQLEQLAMTYCP